MPRPVVFSMQANIRGFQRGIFSAATALGRLDTAARRTGRTLRKMGRAADVSGGGLGKIAGTLGSLGSIVSGVVQGFLALGIAATATFSAIQGAVEATVGSFAEFEARQAIISALFGTTGAAADALQTSVTRVGIASTFTVQEVQGLFRELGQLGTRVQDVDKIGDAVVRLAEVTGSSPVIAAKLLQSQLNAFNLTGESAERVMVALSQAANNSGARMEDLAVALQFVSPAANAVGRNLFDILPAIEAMRNAGIEASVAGTSLRSMFVRLVKPTKQGRLALKSLGIALKDVDPSANGLVEIVAELDKGFTRLGNRSKALAAATAIFGRRAAANIFALTQIETRGKRGAAALRELQRELTDAKSAADRLATIRGTLLATFKRFTATALQTGVIIGDIAAQMLNLVGVADGLRTKMTQVFEVFEGIRKLDKQRLQKIVVELFNPDEMSRVFKKAVLTMGPPLAKLVREAFGSVGRVIAPPLFGIMSVAATIFARGAATLMLEILQRGIGLVFEGLVTILGTVVKGTIEAVKFIGSSFAAVTKFFTDVDVGVSPAAIKKLDDISATMSKMILGIGDLGDKANDIISPKILDLTSKLGGGLDKQFLRGETFGAEFAKRAFPKPTKPEEKFGFNLDALKNASNILLDIEIGRASVALNAAQREQRAQEKVAQAFSDFGRVGSRLFGNLEDKLGLTASPAAKPFLPINIADFSQADRTAQVQTRATQSIESLNDAIQQLIRAFRERNQQQAQFGPLPEPAPTGSVRRVSIGVINNYRRNPGQTTLKGAGASASRTGQNPGSK